MTEKLEKKILNGREYRQLAKIETREEEGEKIVEGYATTFNQPYVLWEVSDEKVLEEVDKKAFDKTDMGDVIFQYDHEGRVYARLSNNTMELEADDHGLKVRANLGGTEEGRNLYEEIAGGYTTRMSFGFTVPEDGETWEELPKDGNQNVYKRTITKIGKLYDVSAVSIPANPNTEIISAQKRCEGALAELKAEREKIAELNRIKQEKVENLKKRIKNLKGGNHGN